MESIVALMPRFGDSLALAIASVWFQFHRMPFHGQMKLTLQSSKVI